MEPIWLSLLNKANCWERTAKSMGRSAWSNSANGRRKAVSAHKPGCSQSAQRTGRLRRVRWIRPVLELRVPKTKIYVNSHSMKPREHGPRAHVEKKRLFITTGTGLLYFISLVYIEHGLALGTAFEPDGRWLREMLKKHGTVQLSP